MEHSEDEATCSSSSGQWLQGHSRLLVSAQLLHAQAVEAVALDHNRLESDEDYLPDQVDGDFSVDPTRGVTEVLQQLLSAHNSIFYNQTGFTIDEWNCLCDIMVSKIATTARSGELKIRGRTPKLSLTERLLACILYLRKVKNPRFDKGLSPW
jgi:hypothetical protein